MDWMSMLPLLAQVAGTTVGEIQAGRLSEEQRQVLADAMEQLRNVPEPQLQALVAEQLGPSALSSYAPDPALRGAQMDALGSLARISESGGLTLEDKAALEETYGGLDRQASAARSRIAQDMQARGTLDSGAQQAMQLQAASDTAQAGHRRARDTAAQAQQRALAAIAQRGSQAGAMRGQDFGEAQGKASAADSIARWNAASRQDAGRYNAGLPQQAFENRFRKAAAAVPGANAYAANRGQAAQHQRDFWGGLGNAGAQAAYGYTQKPRPTQPTAAPYPETEPDEWGNPYGY
jgi:hypothetical protein